MQTAVKLGRANRLPARVIQEAQWRCTYLQFAGVLGWMRTLAVAFKAGIRPDDDVNFGGRAPLTPRVAFLGHSYNEMPSARVVQLALKHGVDPNRPIQVDPIKPAVPLLNHYADLISGLVGRPASVVSDALRAMQALMQMGAKTFEQAGAQPGHQASATVGVVQAIAMALWLSTRDSTQAQARPTSRRIRGDAPSWKLMPELQDAAMQTMRLAVARGASTSYQAWSDDPLLATLLRNGAFALRSS